MIGDESSPNVTRDMHALALTCKSLQVEAEVVLYRRISLLRRPGDPQFQRKLHAFAQAVAQVQRPWRALAVRSMRLHIPRFCSIAAQDVFKKLVNLTDLEVYWDNDSPPFSLIWTPLRLNSLKTALHGFCQVHLHQELRRTAQDASWDLGSVLQPCPIKCFSTITTLALQMGDLPLEHAVNTADVLRYCSWYNITYLNLSGAPRWSTCREVLHALGARLVSFRVALGARPLAEIPGCSRILYEAPLSWPTQMISDATFPALKYLEVYESYDNFRHVSASIWCCG